VGYYVQGLGIHCGKAEAAERDLTELCPAVGAADENRCAQSEPSRCAAGCRDGGTCNEELARCDCKIGRRGEACEIFESQEYSTLVLRWVGSWKGLDPCRVRGEGPGPQSDCTVLWLTCFRRLPLRQGAGSGRGGARKEGGQTTSVLLPQRLQWAGRGTFIARWPTACTSLGSYTPLSLLCLAFLDVAFRLRGSFVRGDGGCSVWREGVSVSRGSLGWTARCGWRRTTRRI
jgi:hypothetical protein